MDVSAELTMGPGNSFNKHTGSNTNELCCICAVGVSPVHVMDRTSQPVTVLLANDGSWVVHSCATVFRIDWSLALVQLTVEGFARSYM